MAASKILRSTYFTSPATGVSYWVDESGKAIPADQDEDDYFDEMEMRAEAAREEWENGGRDRYEAWDRGY